MLLDNNSYALSTIDNPWNPLENFNEWFVFDVAHGYNSCGILAALVGEQTNLSPREQQTAISDAIDTFIEADPLRLYIKVTKHRPPTKFC